MSKQFDCLICPFILFISLIWNRVNSALQPTFLVSHETPATDHSYIYVLGRDTQASLLGNFAPFATFSCLCPLLCCLYIVIIFVEVVARGHVDNIVIQTVTSATNGRASLPHNYTFYLSLEKLDILTVTCLLLICHWVCSEVVELLHRINSNSDHSSRG